jgi:hypothetical protein
LIALRQHPDAPGRAVRGIRAAASRDGAALRLTYLIEGSIEALRLPPRGLRPLWQHTCCEAFVGGTGSPAYREFNFAPSGDWAAYAFAGYRDGRPAEIGDPRIAVRLSASALELSASVGVSPGALRIGLAAVIEERDGRRSYWALRHPPGRPDFHHRDGFALELE